MNYGDLLLLAQLVAGGMLFWSSFCRLRRTDHTTIRGIKTVIWLQSVSALSLICAPYLPLVEPTLWWPPFTTPIEVWLFVAAMAAAIQIVTARHWINGVPRSYVMPEHRPRTRRDDFTSTEFASTLP